MHGKCSLYFNVYSWTWISGVSLLISAARKTMESTPIFFAFLTWASSKPIPRGIDFTTSTLLGAYIHSASLVRVSCKYQVLLILSMRLREYAERPFIHTYIYLTLTIINIINKEHFQFNLIQSLQIFTVPA